MPKPMDDFLSALHTEDPTTALRGCVGRQKMTRACTGRRPADRSSVDWPPKIAASRCGTWHGLSVHMLIGCHGVHPNHFSAQVQRRGT